MDTAKNEARRVHVVALPHRGRGHMNPMLSFCRSLIANSARAVHVSLIVTEDFRLGSTTPEVDVAGVGGSTIRLMTMPKAETAERVKGSDLPAFIEMAQSDMEEAFERLLDRLKPPPDFIVADSFVGWAVELGKRRNIPVASFWPLSASVFSVFYHHHQFVVSSHFYPILGSECEERIDFIPGIPSVRLADLPGDFQTEDKRGLNMLTTIISTASKAQCVMFRTINELKKVALDALKTAITSVPLYHVGLAIPYSSNIGGNPKVDILTKSPDYMKWLDTQQESSVLYVSLGTFLSPSDAQIDELVTGLREFEVPFLWVRDRPI